MHRELTTRGTHPETYGRARVSPNNPLRKLNDAHHSELNTSRPRWVLYHGTSSARLKHILDDDCLRISGGERKAATAGTRGRQSVAAHATVAHKFTPGMMVWFTNYRPDESGMFAPGEEIYIHSVEEQDHASIKGKKIEVYICTKAADADAAKADPNLDNVQAEEIRLSEMQLRTDPNTRDPISAYMAPSAISEPQLALTTERSVAEYWACLAVFADRQDHPEAESNPVVLVLDGRRLLELRYPLTQIDDQIWDDEEDDVKYGIACLQDIDPLSEVLIVTEPAI